MDEGFEDGMTRRSREGNSVCDVGLHKRILY